ncbi:protein of unknown function [Nocardioides terrae]|uniref:DUF222 domain-containing protein n=1 Tax=Nocardioides terrae TaxID=574651 RepID=A0A1I1MHK9_9ACTN|nr:DUF222 domain-containing protein [Nocardioides terrae]SFC84929.1 protein of unknown function [Nocardioides terrae]
MSLSDLDATATLAAADGNLRRRRVAEVEELEIALRWADLHSSDPQAEPEAIPVRYGGDRLVHLGGEGTPAVRELCLLELAVAFRCSEAKVRSTVAAGLDLRHRLPLLWDVVRKLDIETWVARRIARMTRRLPHGQAASVDALLTDAAAESPAKLLRLVETAIMQVDAEAERERLDRARRSRGVWVSRPRPGEEDDEQLAGLRTVIARVTTADAIWFDATVDQIADLLASLTDRLPHLADLTRDELRAEAFGWLARPQELAGLIADSTGDADEAATALAALPRPDATVYVHVGDGPVADVEQLGPLLVERLAELLGHTRITLRPVIDLHEGRSVTGYTHPADVRERCLLRTGGDRFPHSAGSGRNVDLDHPQPFDADGPPGQTGDHNALPLRRRHHRAKTHLGYVVTPLGPDRWTWRTPHCLTRLVDARGTHAVSLGEEYGYRALS